jgi:hypothetical protein
MDCFLLAAIAAAGKLASSVIRSYLSRLANPLRLPDDWSVAYPNYLVVHPPLRSL